MHLMWVIIPVEHLPEAQFDQIQKDKPEIKDSWNIHNFNIVCHYFRMNK